MAKALSKSQLVTAIAEKAEISKKQAGEILDHLASLAYKHAKDTFTLPGIGKLAFGRELLWAGGGGLVAIDPVEGHRVVISR